eukprot:XP_025015448.1 uncharacterized protein LOC8262341 [Ricinus communis]
MLDQCTDGTIGQFDEFLRERGHEPLSPSILKALGKKPDDHIGFNDFLILMYIVKTRRPCCDLCQTFLQGLYFTCAICFETEEKPFNLCLSCISKQKNCLHGHGLLVDNFAMLHSKSKALKLQLEKKPLQRRVPMITNHPPTSQEIQLHDLFQHLEDSYVSKETHIKPVLFGSSDSSGDNTSKVCNIG